MKWLIERLREPSSWRGLVWLATAAGISLSPEAWEYVMAIGMAVAGLVGVLSKEETKRELPPIDLVAEPESVKLRGDAPGTAESELPARTDAEDRRVGKWDSSGFNG